MKAFTLVELLVVIAIISILVALLIPSLQSARELAKSVRCVNNLKQISVALALYEGQYTVLPAAYNASATPGNLVTWQGKLFTAGFLGGVTRPEFWGATITNCELLKCPSNTLTFPSSILPVTLWHYGMNSVLAQLLGIPGGTANENWREAFVPRVRISKPGRRLLVGEASNCIIGGPTTDSGPLGNAWYPHRHGMNVLYLDYHVAFVSQTTLTAQYRQEGCPFGDKE